MKNKDVSELELSLLLEAVFQEYGYDFRQYSRAHVKRRITSRIALAGLENAAEMQHLILTNHKFTAQVLQDLSITVTEMFRDHRFYSALRETILPILRTYPFIKIWHAGCATGEEAYSMAIILEEAGLYDRTTIYATDFNQMALDRAKEGIFSNNLIKEYTGNYQLSGGKNPFSHYYTSDSSNVIMTNSIKRNIVWANHNLVTDGVFAEMNLILCRNVLIYFDKKLQNKVQHLFYDSLISGGILCLGNKESLDHADIFDSYSELNRAQRIFKKKY